ncbi:MAG TPA: PBP1A family penicillin-binding protein [Candidatus Limnocylindrales bacterium]|nr:PBP1A family penicillin-binding protein [Candidatus Limnocylindrales bacterium]
MANDDIANDETQPVLPAKKPKKKVRLRRTRRFLRGVLLICMIAGVAGAVWGSRWFDQNVLSTLPENLAHVQAYRPPSNCVIYDAAGTPVDEFYVERRIWVPIKDLPDHIWQAFVAAEDRRFFTHRGVDPAGILRALASNYFKGGVHQGGSTITQQIVKNLLVGKERSYIRKMREAVLAMRLERELTKKELLELYINYVYLGSGNYGVEAAALDYFGKPAAELDAGQAAMLAGLVPAPTRYSPHKHPESALARRSYVLGRMVEEGYITLGDARTFAQEPVVLPIEKPTRTDVGLAYLTEVRREIRRLFGSDTPLAQGFHVYTPLDLTTQATAETAVRDALHAVDDRRGRRGVVEHLGGETQRQAFLARAAGLQRIASPESLDAPGDRETEEAALAAKAEEARKLAEAAAKKPGQNIKKGAAKPAAPLPIPAIPPVARPRPDDCFEAMVGKRGLDDLQAGPFSFALVKGDRSVTVRGTDGKSRHMLSSVAGTGDVLKVCLIDDKSVRLDPKPWAEGASVVIDNATGRVRALVGGYHDVLEGFVRATQARRQPGSSFKPFVYATALKSGKNQLDIVHDAPISLPGGNGKIWSPANYEDKYYGNLPMRNALAKSLNTVSVRFVKELGPRRVVETARAMGVRTPLRADMSIALGSSEVTPMDLAIAYTTIARMGAPTEPVMIDSIRDQAGKLLGVAGGNVVVDGETVGKLPGAPQPRALPAGIAYELADMMREPIKTGTAKRAFKEGYDRAGKTGTTNECVDAWFVGFDANHTIAVWVGSDGPESIGPKETGGVTSLPAWMKIMDSLEPTVPPRIGIPDEAVLVKIGEGWFGFPRGQIPAKYLDRDAASTRREPLPRFPADG